MKSIEEKAEEYASEAYIVFPQAAVKAAFIAGYKAAQEWISVDDELPSEIGQYLVKKLHGRITVMHFHAPFDSGKRIFQWWGFGRWNDQHKQVTHWKPIE